MDAAGAWLVLQGQRGAGFLDALQVVLPLAAIFLGATGIRKLRMGPGQQRSNFGIQGRHLCGRDAGHDVEGDGAIRVFAVVKVEVIEGHGGG
ncbi:hypothetical protein D3C71_2045770 [compost metagenome]